MKITISITGYYFKYPELYQSIVEEIRLHEDIDFRVFIVSHRNSSFVSPNLLEFFETHNWEILSFPNEGWDWGCHVQFSNYFYKEMGSDSDFFLFLHDDIRIVKNGFIEEFLKKIKLGYSVIGNSLPFSIEENYSKNFPDEVYILERSGFSVSHVQKIEVVRGSAFFIEGELVKNFLTALPFQKFGKIELANRSLRMFAALLASQSTSSKFGYLSDINFASRFIIEEMRGNEKSSFFKYKLKSKRTIKSLKTFTRDFLITIGVLKGSSSNGSIGLLKLNISKENPLTGYLNYDIVNGQYSDIIDFESEVDRLLKQDRISELKIQGNVEAHWLNLVRDFLRIQSKYPVRTIDIFVEGEGCSKEKLDSLTRSYPHISIYSDFYTSGLSINKRILIKA